MNGEWWQKESINVRLLRKKAMAGFHAFLQCTFLTKFTSKYSLPWALQNFQTPIVESAHRRLQVINTRVQICDFQSGDTYPNTTFPMHGVILLEVFYEETSSIQTLALV
jgi:hypothetical protein